MKVKSVIKNILAVYSETFAFYKPVSEEALFSEDEAQLTQAVLSSQEFETQIKPVVAAINILSEAQLAQLQERLDTLSNTAYEQELAHKGEFYQALSEKVDEAIDQQELKGALPSASRQAIADILIKH